MTLHTGKRLQCDLCPDTFNKKISLELHMKLHGFKVTSYLCEICSKELSSKDTLRSHMKTVHNQSNEGKAKVVQCKICSQQFSSRLELGQHKKSQHRKMNCTMCSKSFGDERKLNLHVKMHMGESVPCQVCSKLKMKTHLKRHVFQNHSHKEFERWQKTYGNG